MRFLSAVMLLAWFAFSVTACSDNPAATGGGDGPTVPSTWTNLPAYVESAWLFDDTVVRRIDIVIDPATLTNVVLANYPASGAEEYAVAGSVTIGGETVANVGIRSRGNTSDDNVKRQFKLSFNCDLAYTAPDAGAAVAWPANAGRRFHGVRALNLRASQNDPTILREMASSYVFQRAGACASRCGFARVFLNGEYWGLYLMVEQTDKSLLDARFGENDGNLYKSLYGAIAPGNEAAFELKTNETTGNTGDLTAFFTALAAATTRDALAAIVDPGNIIAYLAAAGLVGHWDSFAESLNNDYLYHNADGRFRIIAWDLDNTFGSGSGVWGIDALHADPYALCGSQNWSNLFSKIMADATWKAQYKTLLQRLLADTFTQAHLGAKIDAWKALIQADVLVDARKHLDWHLDFAAGNTAWAEGFTQKPAAWAAAHTYDRFASYQGGLKTWITDRASYVASHL